MGTRCIIVLRKIECLLLLSLLLSKIKTLLHFFVTAYLGFVNLGIRRNSKFATDSIIGFAFDNNGIFKLMTTFFLLLNEYRNIKLLILGFLRILGELVGGVYAVEIRLIGILSSEVMGMLVGTFLHLQNMIVSDIIDVVIDIIIYYCYVISINFFSLLFKINIPLCPLIIESSCS